MRAPIRRAVWIGALIGVGTLLGGMGQSAGGLALASGMRGDSPVRCSNATLHGTYNFATESIQVSQPGAGPFAYAGLIMYDGKGGDTEVYTISSNGVITHAVRESGTYHVNPDCTGTETDTGPDPIGTQHYDEFLSPDGSQFAYIQTDQGVVSAGTVTRTVSAQDTN